MCVIVLENGKRSSEEETDSKESEATSEEGQGKATKERKKRGKSEKTEGKVVYDRVSCWCVLIAIIVTVVNSVCDNTQHIVSKKQTPICISTYGRLVSFNQTFIFLNFVQWAQVKIFTSKHSCLCLPERKELT